MIEKLYGLIGRDIQYSYSKLLFDEQCRKRQITNSEYKIFDIENIVELETLINENENLCGFNVTIPYKLDVFNYLNYIEEDALYITAVNYVAIENGMLYGQNTDYIAFRDTVSAMLKRGSKAIVLGSGGAARAVAFALAELDTECVYVSRNPDELTIEIKCQAKVVHSKNKNCKEVFQKYKDFQIISYGNELAEHIREADIIVNATPCGTKGLNLNLSNYLNFELIPEGIILYDLVYNPAETEFLNFGRKYKNCRTINGMAMLLENVKHVVDRT